MVKKKSYYPLFLTGILSLTEVDNLKPTKAFGMESRTEPSFCVYSYGVHITASTLPPGVDSSVLTGTNIPKMYLYQSHKQSESQGTAKQNIACIYPATTVINAYFLVFSCFHVFH